MFDRIRLWSHSGPGLLFVVRFLIIVSISLLVIGLFTFSISSWFSLGRLCLSKNLSISSFYWHTIACNSLTILCISIVSICNFSFFISIGLAKIFVWVFSVRCNGKTGTNFLASSIILSIWGLFLFFWWVWLKLYQFCLSKNQLLVLLIFAFVFISILLLF